MDDILGTPRSAEIFTHVRVIVGMVLGLSVSRLIMGLTRFVQHPSPGQFHIAHLAWVLFLLLFIIHFWWFELAFSHLSKWSFTIYFFLVFYAGVFAALSSILFPDRMEAGESYAQYFNKRRIAFFSVLLLLFVVDIVDTIIKGLDYYYAIYGWYYPFRQAILMLGALIALSYKSERYQTYFAIFALLFQVVWIASLFESPR